MVIEDHRAQQEVLRAAFEARSQRVFVAGTGAAGLELVDTVNPTLVIIDRKGIVSLYNPGQLTEAALEKHIRPLLALVD